MPGKQMLCCILISIISEGDMKIFISLFLFIISTSSFADDITHAGVVRIEGLITEKTCIISDESKNFTANMPDVPSSSVRSAGDVTEKVYFSITLTRCGSDVGNAYIKFTGNTVSRFLIRIKVVLVMMLKASVFHLHHRLIIYCIFLRLTKH